MRSFAAALVFAAHPLFAQAVAWIPGRGDLLLGLFGICAFVALVKFRKSGKFRHCAVSAAALFCALLSKENAVALPLLFAAYLLLCDRERGLHRRYLAAAVSWLAVCAAYLVLRKAAMNGLPGGGTFGFGVLIGNLRALPELLTGFFVPYDIPVMPSFTLSSTAIGSAAVLLIVIALGMQGRLRRPMVLFGALWFVLLSLPGMMYRQELGPHAFTYLNHRSYLPMAGLFIVLLEALPDFKRRGLPVFSLVAVAGGVAALCMLANRQSAFFANPVAFYDQAIRTNPESAFALNNRASLRSESGDVRGAIRDVDRALRLHPDFPVGLLNRGYLAAYVGDTAGACMVWRRAATLGNAMARDLVRRYCR